MQKNLKKTLATYDAQKGIDRLHRILLDAEARQKHGEEPRKDIYQADLDPRTAVCARTVPLLEKEAERLRAEIAAVRLLNPPIVSFLTRFAAGRGEPAFVRRNRGECAANRGESDILGSASRQTGLGG